MFEINDFYTAGKFFLVIAGELVLIFVAVAFIVGLLLEYLPPSHIRGFLAGRLIGVQYFLGAGLGAITPFCSCSTVPILTGLLRGGVPFGPVMAFLFASPAEGQNLFHQIAGPIARFQQFLKVPLDQTSRGHFQTDELGTTDDRRQDVIEIMGDASGQGSQGFHLLRLGEVLLHPPLLLDQAGDGHGPADRVGQAFGESEVLLRKGPILLALQEEAADLLIAVHKGNTQERSQAFPEIGD